MLEIQDVLGTDGLLAKELPGFAVRQQQTEMAEAIAQTLNNSEVLIAEAGTGTGKTFAYLVPALLSGAKVIISTGTKNLQDQLFLRDLPRVSDALASPAKTALLKGRANYLCIHRLDSALTDTRGYRREVSKLLARVRDWSGMTKRGDISELTDVPEDAPVWPLITSTTDNCLGQECPAWSKCHLVEARRNAQEADIVVINHHLLCADFALKGDGFGELLPAADAFIVDEAHQLPEVASNFFGLTVSSRQLLELSRDSEAEYHREAGDMPAVIDHTDKVAKAAQDLRLAFGTGQRRAAWRDIEADSSIVSELEKVRSELNGLQEILRSIEGRGKGLDSCLARTEAMLKALKQLCEPEDELRDIRWFETHRQSVRLNSTPLDIADVFRATMERHPASWVFTSATLAVGDSFSHFQAQLGLQDAKTAKWDSPFDYARQALWFVPRNMPAPNEAGYIDAVVNVARPLLEASHGRAFLLFTSHRALQAAADQLLDTLDYPVLVQGSVPKSELIARFVEHGNAVLLGTTSFWEGVDVRGDALSLVIIDKLPFAAPGDPVLQARLDALKKNGQNPFMAFQVPQAAIALKQGAGRLIRDVTDRGVLVMCDPRMLKKSYGHVFLDAMPPFARTRELEDVQTFFAEEMACA